MDDSIISNTSTTNKDFNSIYTELLDLVKKLTTKWDPSLSNESDPGVLLLKLNALIADKNNYNIDKNVLECFPTSVTQEGNARKIYDSLGYKMGWYKSATIDIGFQLRSNETITGLYTIPQFTMVMDSSGEIVYTTLGTVYLNGLAASVNNIVTVEAMEGKIYDYELNGSTDISLDSLDENYRLYFDSSLVSENGIFIKCSNDVVYDFTKVDNIVAQELGTKCYEFGVTNDGSQCYIQFPEDINSVISSDPVLNIKYIIGSGEEGNIKANTLDTFYEDLTYGEGDDAVVVSDQIRIIQTTSTINGEDKESISEAYKNYKRTVGTFDTLVTRRDFENYIYNAEVDNENLVSNVVVSDRTCDLNASTKVQVWNPNYTKTQTAIAMNDDNEASLTAYDVVIYALKSKDDSDFENSTSTKDIIDAYNTTFEPISDGYITSVMEDLVDDIKAIPHDYQIPLNLISQSTDSIKYLYKNVVALKGQLVTYSKVSASEAAEIEENVTNALAINYKSRNLTFGEEITYDDLITTITEADSRIKSVALNVPTYQIMSTVGSNDSTYGDNYLTIDEKLNIVARMILSGNVQLFKFDTNFTYEFGETNSTTYPVSDSDYIKYITTEAKITLDPGTDDSGNANEVDESNYSNYAYTLGENEAVQLMTPSYITSTEYSTYVKFNLYASEYTEVGTLTSFASGTTYYTYESGTYKEVDEYEIVSSYDSSKGSLYILNNSTYKAVPNPENITDFTDTTYYQKSVPDSSTTYYTLGKTIEAGEDYCLQSGEYLVLYYKDSDSVVQYDRYGAGTIINCSIQIASTSYDANVSKQLQGNTYKPETFNYTLSTGQSLSIKEINRSTLNAGTKYCFILNDNKLVLNDSNLYRRVLQEGEYFIYTNSSTTELIILGSGTMLSSDEAVSVTQGSIDLDAIEDGDTSSVSWLALTTPITITEMEITTLTEGAKIASDNPIVIDNILRDTTSYEVASSTDSSDTVYYTNMSYEQVTSKAYNSGIAYYVNSSGSYTEATDFTITEYEQIDLTESTFTANQYYVLNEETYSSAETYDDNATYYKQVEYLDLDNYTLYTLEEGAYGIATDTSDTRLTYYTKTGDFATLYIYSDDALSIMSYYIDGSDKCGVMYQSRLTLSVSAGLSQELVNTSYSNGTAKCEQSVTLTYYTTNAAGDEVESGTAATIISASDDQSIQISFNNAVAISGGSNVDASVLSDDGISYTLAVRTYTIDDSYTSLRDNSIIKLAASNFTADDDGNTYYLLPFTFEKGSQWLLPLYVNITSGNEGASFSIYGVTSSEDLSTSTPILLYDYQDSEKYQFDGSGSSYTLNINPSSLDFTALYITYSGTLGENDTIIIGMLSKVEGFNTDEINVIAETGTVKNTYSKYDEFILDSKGNAIQTYSYDVSTGEGTATDITSTSTIVGVIKNILDNASEKISFNWAYQVPSSKKVKQPTASSSYWNQNHLCNKYTIPMIDFDNTDIEVNAYSISE